MEEVHLLNRTPIFRPQSPSSSFLLPTSSRACATLLTRLRPSRAFPLNSRSSPSSSSLLLSSPKGPPCPLPPLPLEDDVDGPEEEASMGYGFRFREKVMFLESYMDMDSFDLTSIYSQIVSTPLEDVKSTVGYLESVGFTPPEIRRICFCCPEVLTSTPTHLSSVFTFLLREALVKRSNIHRVINRRPRLLVSDVEERLRPTLYFLKMLGITDTAKHAILLSCSVENKLLPKIEYLEGAGFSPEDARLMFRKFPPLFCHSIAENLQPKFSFYVMEMERDLQELKGFPQYFSFSLHRRIIPRHQACKEKGLFLALPSLLLPVDENFWARI